MRNLILLICAALACCKSEREPVVIAVPAANVELLGEAETLKKFAKRMESTAKNQAKVGFIFTDMALASIDDPALNFIGQAFEGLTREQQDVYKSARQLQVEVKKEVLELQKEIRLYHESQQNEALEGLLKSMGEYSIKDGMNAILRDFDLSRSGHVIMYTEEWAEKMKIWAKLLNEVKQEVSK